MLNFIFERLKMQLKDPEFLNWWLTLVQGLMVGPTPNPLVLPILFKRILLSKKLFPVLYFPATAMTPTLLLTKSSLCKNSIASGATKNPISKINYNKINWKFSFCNKKYEK